MPEPVYLRVYDLSDGAIRAWSPVLLGKRIEGIWHTGLELFGTEYFYGGGIVKLKPSEVEKFYSITPYRVHQLGTTTITKTEFEAYLVSIKPDFSRECYDLIKWNCNNFTDHVSCFLLKRGIPTYIMNLPEEITTTFMGRIIISFIKMFTDAPAIDSEDAHHPKQTLGLGFNRTGRRHSCPGSPISTNRSCYDTGHHRHRNPFSHSEQGVFKQLKRDSLQTCLGRQLESMPETKHSRSSDQNDASESNSDRHTSRFPASCTPVLRASLATTVCPQSRSRLSRFRRSSAPLFGFPSLPLNCPAGSVASQASSTALETSRSQPRTMIPPRLIHPTLGTRPSRILLFGDSEMNQLSAR